MGYLRDAATGEIFGNVDQRLDSAGEYYFFAELVLSPARDPGDVISRSFYTSPTDCATAEHRAIAWLMAELERG